MSPEEIKLIETVAIEAIKILGPAIIAAYAGYKAGSIQLQAKLVELDKTNQFRARESVFLHLKERLSHIDEQIQKLNGEISQLVGFITGYRSDEPSSDSDDFIGLMADILKTMTKQAPLEVAILIGDLRAANLASSEEFKAISSYKAAEFHIEATYDSVKSNALQLLEIYQFLANGTRLLLEKRMEKIYAPYLNSP